MSKAKGVIVDFEDLAQSLIQSSLENSVMKVLIKQDKKVSFALMSLVSMLDPAVASMLLAKHSEVILNALNAVDANPFIGLQDLSVHPSRFRQMFRQKINILKNQKDQSELPDQTKKKMFSVFREIILGTPQSNLFEGACLSISSDISSLAALVVVDKYIDGDLPELASDDTLRLICRVLLRVIDEVSPDTTVDYRCQVALMLVLGEAYKRDISVYLAYMKYLTTKERSALESTFINSFMQSGMFDAGIFQHNLKKLIPIESVKDVEEMTKLLKMAEDFEESQDDLARNIRQTMGIQLTLKILQFMHRIPSITFKEMSRCFNELIDSCDDLAEFSLTLVARQLDLPEFGSSLLCELLKSLSGILIELIVLPDTGFRLKQQIFMIITQLIGKADRSESKFLIVLLEKICAECFGVVTEFDVSECLTIQLNSRITRRDDLPSLFRSINLTILEAVESRTNIRVPLMQAINQGAELMMGLLRDQYSKAILTASEVNAIVNIRLGFRELVQNNKSLPLNKAIELDIFLNGLLVPFNNEPQICEELTLLLTRQVLVAYPNMSMLKEAGFTKLVSLIYQWSPSSQKRFTFIDPELFKISYGSENRVLTAEPTAIEMTDYSLDYNYPRLVDLLNVLLNQNLPADTTAKLERRLAKMPLLSKFYAAALANVKNNQLSEEQIFQVMLVGAVATFTTCLPAENPLSTARHTRDQVNVPLINYPAARLKFISPIMQLLTDKTNTNPSLFGRPVADVNAVWECMTPGCKNLVPIGDCGKIAKVGERPNNSSMAQCPGCKQPIGQLGNGGPNLRKVDVDILHKEWQTLKLNDDQQFRPEPVENIEDGWILDKYHETIPSRACAVFIHLVQSLYLLVCKFNQHTFQFPLNPQTEPLVLFVQRDLAILISILEKDSHSVITLLFLALAEAYSQLSNPRNKESLTPQGMRKIFSTIFTRLTASVNNTLGLYLSRKRELNKEGFENSQRQLAFVQGNVSDEELTLQFSQSFLGLNMYLRHLKPKTISQVIDTLRTYGHVPEVEFLLQLYETEAVLQKLRPIISAIQRFGKYLKSRFDSKIKEKEATHSISIKTLIGKTSY